MGNDRISRVLQRREAAVDEALAGITLHQLIADPSQKPAIDDQWEQSAATMPEQPEGEEMLRDISRDPVG